MRTEKLLDFARRHLIPREPAAITLALCMGFVTLVTTWFMRLYHGNVIDDAYISFQYTKNWLIGNGIVFNPGERVEGYTNFLWIVVMAPLQALTRFAQWDFTRAAIALTIAFALLDLVLVYGIAKKLFQRDSVAISVPLVLLALDNSYLGYAVSALENHLLIACLLGAVAVWLHRPRHAWLWTGLLLSLLNMTRPDAALAVSAFGLSGLLSVALQDKCFPKESRAKTAGRLFATCGVWLLLFGAYFLWRWRYYGYLLPNTAYLKVADSFDAVHRGLDYTKAFLEDRYYLPVLGIAALPGIRNPIVRWLLLWSLLHVAYVSYVGGDFYSGHRFYVAMLPAVYLLLGWVVHALRRLLGSTRVVGWIRQRAPLAAASIAVGSGVSAWGLCYFTLRGFERGPYTNEILLFSGMVDNNIRFTRWLGTYAEPGSSLVLGDIGSAGFLANVRVVDIYGVIDPVTAHKKVKGLGKGKPGHEKVASRDYVLSKNPQYVKWGYLPGDLQANGYYIFTDFPRGFHQDGLWVREDLGAGYYLPETAVHFLPTELKDWERTGDAFQVAPTERPVKGQTAVFGQVGGYANSYTAEAGDRATGSLRSPAFELRGDLMLLRVGGGRDPEHLRVSLIIDGQRAFSATGHDSEVLGRRVWRIEPYMGQQGQIEIVDGSDGGWGHILVDEVVQWVGTR